MQADNWSFEATGTEEGLAFLEVEGVRIYDARHLFPLAIYADGAVEKLGYTAHHDAGAYSGTTVADDIARMQAIDRDHRESRGWPGIGYHRMISPAGRVYLTGSSATQRAHVRGQNHLWIGYCFMGDYSTARPPEAAMAAFRVATQWETDRRGVAMQLAPHKRVNAGETACPGSWATSASWADVLLRPRGTPPPHPPPDPSAALEAWRDQVIAAAEGLARLAREMPQ